MIEDYIAEIMDSEPGIIEKVRFNFRNLFINESVEEYLTSKVKKRLREKGKDISSTSIRDKVGINPYNMVYIIEDNVSVGYRVNKKGIYVKSPPFKRLRGDYSLCRKFIHKDDPLFKDKKVDIYPESGVMAAIDHDNQRYLLSTHAFRKFETRAKNASSISEECNTSREYLDLLHRIFLKSKPAVRRNNVRQIIEHGFQAADYRITKNWIFVVIRDNNVINTIYEKSCGNALYRRVS
ncbi:hypothetical protein C0585_08195 [Candidatus Woesearchaeota archaeon]|nr:MAG: hypothetical protein C0585_08195 [Candidatus Woesearchaeota archaeon]